MDKDLKTIRDSPKHPLVTENIGFAAPLQTSEPQRFIGLYPLDTVLFLDCIEGMSYLPDQSVDIAIADPPYNLSKGNIWKWDNSVDLPGFGGNWSKVMVEWDKMPLMDYLLFTLKWISEMKRVVRPTGSLWIHGTYHNIGIINFALQLLKIEIINEVIWYKRNSFPNLSGRRLTASHETILWAHTGKKRQYYFNYGAAKNMSLTEDNLKVPGKQLRTVWDIPNNKDREEIRYGKHPTQKPVRLLRRMLALSAKPGQICLVPFTGSGSECVAALTSGLHFIAFENNPEYVEICKSRISALSRNMLSHQKEKSQGAHAHIAEMARKYTSTRAAQSPVRHIPPLIKWTGSKRSQASTIASYIPDHDRYFEPFVGGGAVLFAVGGRSAVAGDIYAPLIELWQIVQSSPEVLIDDYREQWEKLQERLPDYFYEVRERFNNTKNPLDLNFLLRTCVNGIVRFNRAGEFNNSFHLSRRGMSPDRFESVVKMWHGVIKDVRFVCQDYTETLKEAHSGDFAYLDPPYLGNKQRYMNNIDFGRMYGVLEDLNRRGVKWAMSFDGRRGGCELAQSIPRQLYMRRILVTSGNSAVGKVLNGSLEMVEESLYLNY